MCRIFGTFGTTATEDELARVSARQRHGGPDGSGLATGTGWALGCDRLAVTDPAGGRQPYRLPSAPGIMAVLNGQLYNHHALRTLMAARGHAFPDTCDGTLLPALYFEYGVDFAERLEGMFAIALLDLRDAPRLVLATDDAGMKTVYHHTDVRGGIHFASELPALLAFQAVPAEPRPEALDEYLTTRTCLGERTALRHVNVLTPGATAVSTASGKLRLRRRAPLAHALAPTATDLRAPGPGVRRVLRREVSRLTRADAPVCVITSGGLDSGLITALAAERAAPTDAPLHTFHLTYRGRWPGSEHGYARAVSSRCGTAHHQIEADPAEFPELLPKVVRHLGQPNADPIALSSHVLYRAIRDAGFTVALTGDGADELYGGYDRVRTALAAAPGSDWVAPYIEALAAIGRPLRERLYTATYRESISAEGTAADRVAARLRGATRGDGPAARLAALTTFETDLRLPAYHLRRTDHLSMAAGVEARMPFCQPALDAWSRHLSVPARTGKRALYAAASGLLPGAVLRRPKQPFTLPVTAMLRPGQPLWALARDMLAPDRLRRDGRLSPARVTALLDRQARRPEAASGAAVWALLIHELWRTELALLAAGRRHGPWPRLGNVA